MLKAFSFLFILLFSAVPALAIECDPILAGKRFNTDGYEALNFEAILTSEEAQALHTKLVKHIKESGAHHTLDLWGYNRFKSLDEAIQFPEMLKLLEWVEKVKTEVMKRLSEEEPSMFLESVRLFVSNSEMPNRFSKFHEDGNYARILTTLLGPTTMILDGDIISSLPIMVPVLISGKYRTFLKDMPATTHSSPYDEKSNRLFLQFSFASKGWPTHSRRPAALTSGKTPRAKD